MSTESDRKAYGKIERLARRHNHLLFTLGRSDQRTIDVGAECFDRAQALRRGETLPQYRKHLKSI